MARIGLTDTGLRLDESCRALATLRRSIRRARSARLISRHLADVRRNAPKLVEILSLL
jgi:hypothetical protein